MAANADEIESFWPEEISKKIITEDGEVRYYIKWKSLKSSEYTWESKGNSACDNLIEEFEKKRQKKAAKKGSLWSMCCPTLKKKKPLRNSEPRGFARGLKPVKILRSMDKDGELRFLMQWEGTSEVDVVSSKEARQKCAQIVINFYEEMLGFTMPF